MRYHRRSHNNFGLSQACGLVSPQYSDLWSIPISFTGFSFQYPCGTTWLTVSVSKNSLKSLIRRCQIGKSCTSVRLQRDPCRYQNTNFRMFQKWAGGWDLAERTAAFSGLAISTPQYCNAGVRYENMDQLPSLRPHLLTLKTLPSLSLST